MFDEFKNQTLKDIEILLVDDGSTDNSYEICKSFEASDSRIRVFKQENSGQSAARNRALSVSKGEYIAFTDSDDWVDCDFYEKLLKLLFVMVLILLAVLLFVRRNLQGRFELIIRKKRFI